ncbi:hypothetical protein BUALT_Bualt07G0114200 [Buddleja alternifolia]|uniref:Uncharacterized protein n=1 Tax=Buddleja alternifolia TaxID=168488 RepID=A0AAV6XKU7_9LAMI|nr:hypothetical protein BUALT_Bualt07G0114200 [Buddleja alternifolia]
MAAAVVGCGSAWAQIKDSSSIKNHVKNNNNKNKNKKGFRVSCVYSSAAVGDPYKTLRITPSASESEYHPDVCRGSNCGIQFHQINEAYDIVMSNLRGETSSPAMEMYENYDVGGDEPMRGMFDQDWDMWEEWMGWEGAGIRDYSSHVNPYI